MSQNLATPGIVAEFDPNIRVENNWTFVGMEDITGGPLEVGANVTVCEPESGMRGEATIARINSELGFIYLAVDWGNVRIVKD